MRHVFFSYCHENKAAVNQLGNELTSQGVTVWMDSDNIGIGNSWKQVIQQTIQYGYFFIACFSKQYKDQDRGYMSEELSIAVERLKKNLMTKFGLYQLN